MQHAVDTAVEEFDGHDLAESGIRCKHVGNRFFQQAFGFRGNVADGALDVKGDSGFANGNGRQRGDEEGGAAVVVAMRDEIVPKETIVKSAAIAIYADESRAFWRPFVAEIGGTKDRGELCKADVVRRAAEIREIALDEIGALRHQLFELLKRFERNGLRTAGQRRGR